MGEAGSGLRLVLCTCTLLQQVVLPQAVCPIEEDLGKEQAHRVKPGLHMRAGQALTQLPPAGSSLSSRILSATTHVCSWGTARLQGAVCPVTTSPWEYPTGQMTLC